MFMPPEIDLEIQAAITYDMWNKKLTIETISTRGMKTIIEKENIDENQLLDYIKKYDVMILQIKR
ncbi:hypothetical protein [Methanobrevibacter thaueri]|uniref:Uncharacterized protein n=1 Tax=Methanobrevibacter thaueri TaxID=190975 RepID=A0A315YB38_9EURY|nr:hypothetical protein [Methanobrevibacter thaueri]PWB87892.1 hypothetical protein MBBTH_04790 [Methanobrevibacter thaueri]